MLLFAVAGHGGIEMDVRGGGAWAAEFDHAIGARLGQILSEVHPKLAQRSIVQLLLGVCDAIGFLQGSGVGKSAGAFELGLFLPVLQLGSRFLS